MNHEGGPTRWDTLFIAGTLLYALGILIFSFWH